MVIILSDMEGMVGGELEVLKQARSPEATEAIKRAGGPPRDKVEKVSYQKAGWGIFAQGSQIMHRVAPVTASPEQRISFVFSLMTTDVFDEDKSRTLKINKDHKNILAWETARHNAWRAKGQLDYILKDANPNQMNPADFAAMLEETSAKLKRAADIIMHRVDDAIGFAEDSSQ